MEKITLLAKKLHNDLMLQPELKHLTLKQGEVFGWDHTACAITYAPHAPDTEAYFLHECGHALLGHCGHPHDVELISMERAAWDKAHELGAQYGVTIDAALIESSLDTYRDWLHARSLCPLCSATGVQTATHGYRCLACAHEWRSNDARTCSLRRYRIKKRP